MNSGFLNLLIHCTDYFAHGVLSYRIFFTTKLFFRDHWKSNGTLPCVVGNCIRNQIDPKLVGNLLHYCSLTNSGRSHQQDWSLSLSWYLILAGLILLKIGANRIFHFFFRLVDIHNDSLVFWNISSFAIISQNAGFHHFIPPSFHHAFIPILQRKAQPQRNYSYQEDCRTSTI